MPELDLGPLDDSRLKGYNGKITHPTLPLERTFCSLCGKPKGWVTHDSSEFIDAENVVVVCDECDEKYKNLLGGRVAEVPIPEFGFDENASTGSASLQWVENCLDCLKPMKRLGFVPAGIFQPKMETLRAGNGGLSARTLAALEQAKQTAVPEWVCPTCKGVWGTVYGLWCKFIRVK